MAGETQVLTLYPWIGGLNTSLDSSVIGQSQLVKANNLVFGTRGSRKKRPGINFNWDSKQSRSVASSSGLVDESGDTITYNSHGFVNGDKVLYTTTNTAIGGLTTNTVYYVVGVTTNTFQLSTLPGYTAINLTDDGVGTHTFNPLDNDIVGLAEYWHGTSTKSLVLVALAEDGTLYKYTSAGVRSVIDQRKYIDSSSGLVTEGSDTINFTAHGFSNGDLISYTAPSGAIGGLTDGSRYYVVGATTNTFQLSSTVGGAAINLTSDGSGVQGFGATSNQGTISKCSFAVMNNKLIICSNNGNSVKVWNDATGTVTDLAGSPPNSSMCRVHLGRVWLAVNDRLYYSSTGDPTVWNGTDDSGAIDIGIEDGDVNGMTAFWSFKGDLFVGKRTKLYRMTGVYPEEFRIELISSGVGVSSFNSVTFVDQDDVYWLSDKGIHSLATTANFGNFESKYISKDIQASFNEDFLRSNLDKVWGAYLPQYNSIAFSIAESSDAYNNNVWLYNIPLDAWYRWPSVPCVSMIAVNDSDKNRLYFGLNNEKVAQGMTSNVYDVDVTGTNTAINFECKTGFLFPDSSPYTLKGFKRFGIIYTPDQVHTITASIKIDNNATQSVAFSTAGAADLLGTTFVLGTSILGFSNVLAPYTTTIDGWGRGIQVTLQQTGVNQDVEIQGIQIEWEPGDNLQEVRQ